MLTCLFFGLIAGGILLLARQMLETGEVSSDGKFLGAVGTQGRAHAGITAIGMAVMIYLATMSAVQAVAAPIALIVLAVLAVLTHRSFVAYGEKGQELALYVAFDILLLVAALYINSVVALPQWVKPVALAAGTIAIGWLLAQYFADQDELVDDDEPVETAGWATPTRIIALIVAGSILFFGMDWGGLTGNPSGTLLSAYGQAAEDTDWGSGDVVLDENEEAGAETEYNAGDKVAVNVREGVHFYNADLQSNGKSDDDFNFGPNPYKKGKTAEDYDRDFRERRDDDPMLLSGAMLALDGTLNTDYIGEVLYEGYSESLNMLERADAATLLMNSDAALHQRAAEAVNQLLAKAKKVELRELTDMKDQLYANPDTVSGIPGLVDYQVDYDKGLCLVYIFQVKENSNTTQEVAFHIACGYQWTNGASKIGVTPQPKPSQPKKSNDKPSKPKKDKNPSRPKKKKKKEKDSDPSKPSKKEKDSDPKKPTRKPKKDKKQGTQGEKVKPGEPDEDTNNPSNPQKSKADSKDSSSSQSHSDYKKDQDEKKKANDGSGQKKGGEESKPSTPKKEDTKKVDNNGDKADKPTKKSDSGTAKGQDNDGHVAAPD